jgi:hypothetical protein
MIERVNEQQVCTMPLQGHMTVDVKVYLVM